VTCTQSTGADGIFIPPMKLIHEPACHPERPHWKQGLCAACFHDVGREQREIAQLKREVREFKGEQRQLAATQRALERAEWRSARESARDAKRQARQALKDEQTRRRVEDEARWQLMRQEEIKGAENDRLQRALKWIEANPKNLDRSFSRKSFIYLIRCNEFVKIGIADKPKKRLMGLQCASPYRLTLEHTWPTDNALTDERALHQLLDGKRHLNEWFRLSVDESSSLIAKHPTLGFTPANPDPGY
jgi:hypothetical protein